MTGGLIPWITSNVDIINNIASSMLPIQRLVTGFGYLLGLVFAFKAIATLKQYGESRTMMSSSANMKEPLMYFAVAAMLIYLPSAVDVMMKTSFGTTNILQYQSVDSKSGIINTLFGSNSMVGQSLSIIIQTIGVVAFVRGWVLIARASGQGQQPGGTGKGMIHIFGGILAMNIVLTLQIVNNTLFGTT